MDRFSITELTNSTKQLQQIHMREWPPRYIWKCTKLHCRINQKTISTFQDNMYNNHSPNKPTVYTVSLACCFTITQTNKQRIEQNTKIDQKFLSLQTQTPQIISILTPTNPLRLKMRLQPRQWRMEKLQGLIQFKQKRPFALRGHVTSFFWKRTFYDFAFKNHRCAIS